MAHNVATGSIHPAADLLGPHLPRLGSLTFTSPLFPPHPTLYSPIGLPLFLAVVHTHTFLCPILPLSSEHMRSSPSNCTILLYLQHASPPLRHALLKRLHHTGASPFIPSPWSRFKSLTPTRPIPLPLGCKRLFSTSNLARAPACRIIFSGRACAPPQSSALNHLHPPSPSQFRFAHPSSAPPHTSGTPSLPTNASLPAPHMYRKIPLPRRFCVTFFHNFLHTGIVSFLFMHAPWLLST